MQQHKLFHRNSINLLQWTFRGEAETPPDKDIGAGHASFIVSGAGTYVLCVTASWCLEVEDPFERRKSGLFLLFCLGVLIAAFDRVLEYDDKFKEW